MGKKGDKNLTLSAEVLHPKELEMAFAGHFV